MTDVKIDTNTTWIKMAVLGPIAAFLVGVTVIYMQIKNRMDNQDATQHQMVKSIDNLSAHIGKLAVDIVATRQAQNWIEMARALNREKNPSIVWLTFHARRIT